MIVDAIFGTGFARACTGQLAEVLDHLDHIATHRQVPVVAVDIPSGICADSGRKIGDAAAAELTVSFHRAKRGHYLSDGGLSSGEVVVADIGLLPRQPAPQPWEIPADVARLVAAPDWLGKSPWMHKYSYGHALILSGGSGKTGAARLAARAALRVGAGLVTLGVPPEARIEVASQITALMLTEIGDAEALGEVLQDSRINALCVGPGFGAGAVQRAQIAAALAPPPGEPPKKRRAVVLDADALTAFAEDPDALFTMLHARCVLTPHEGEFARLFPDLAARLNAPPTTGPAYSKVDASREAAARAGCTVLFKGPDTVIADEHGRVAIHAAHHQHGAPWLATAGSGDVLAGLITGLLARGRGAKSAAEIATWLHVQAARRFGPGLIAEDLPEQLPAILRQLEG